MQCLVNRAACRFSWPLDQHIFSSSSSLLPKPADPSESAHRMEDMQAGREGHVWLEHKITFRHFHFASHMFFISCFYVPSQKYIKKNNMLRLRNLCGLINTAVSQERYFHHCRTPQAPSQLRHEEKANAVCFLFLFFPLCVQNSM